VRRVVVLLGTLSLLLVGVTACGSDDGDSGNTGKVTVSGEFGKAPKVTYDGEVNRVTTDTTVLTEGDGATIEDGGTAMLHFYIGNGYTGEKAISTWDQKKPQVVTLNKDTLPTLKDAIVGNKVGSRIQVLATPKDAFDNKGNAEADIGNKDSVVFVIDILSDVLAGPEGQKKPVPPRFPKVIEKDGKVTGLDFSKAGAPPKTLKARTMIQGSGPAITKGSYVAVHYLGQTYDGKKPFDENYSAEQLQPFQIGVGGVIPGWDKSLVGVKQGSRVMLLVPPKDGYGKKGQGKEISGTDTMAFVVDVLGVTP
jgi:FKBP-type peptidyl-prolyl cis-trans isomerase